MFALLVGNFTMLCLDFISQPSSGSGILFHHFQLPHPFHPSFSLPQTSSLYPLLILPHLCTYLPVLYFLPLQYNLYMIFRTARPSPQILDFPNLSESSSFNPQQLAKNSLIEISNQSIDQNFFETTFQPQSKSIRPKQQYRPKQTKPIQVKNEEMRLSVADHFTESHRIRRKKNVKVIEEEASPQPSSQQHKNQSSFIIFQNGYFNKFTPNQYSQLSFGQAFTRTQKIKPPRNIMSLIKRRNLSSIKQQVKIREEDQPSITKVKPLLRRNLSPTERITKSCELKNEFSSISPIKIMSNERIEQGFAELRCTNPNFRNKKVSNYIKMRANFFINKDTK